MPTASVTATITVARTNWVSEIQATRPELSTRAARGARRRAAPTQAQIRSPSARKKYVENSTMKKPGEDVAERRVPTSVTWLTTPPSLACSVERVLGLLDVVVDLASRWRAAARS